MAARMGHLVSVARRSRRWTQADLAAKAGCGLSTVAAAEKGDSRVALQHWLRLLWATDQLERIDEALPPELDNDGVKELHARLPKRVRRSTS
ncbi:MAG TPA: helix-turn-helix domain-containing protein [Solimonas sp.]|nr:helix-turn-helix domain-containing protein [Solimonas sp.]